MASFWHSQEVKTSLHAVKLRGGVGWCWPSVCGDEYRPAERSSAVAVSAIAGFFVASVSLLHRLFRTDVVEFFGPPNSNFQDFGPPGGLFEQMNLVAKLLVFDSQQSDLLAELLDFSSL
jgi:hypothetical protein